MSNFIKKTNKIARAGLSPELAALDKKVGPDALTPDVPDELPTPEPPTIDDARKNRDQLDRIRKRRGVLSNIFGGSSSASNPAVGQARLLGG